MKTSKIFAVCFIFGICAFGNVNGQITHSRFVSVLPVIDEYFDCIDVMLNGEQVQEWFWSESPDGSYNVQVKIDVTLKGSDGKNYTAHQIWNERFNWNENENRLNYLGRWCSTELLMCEGKLVGVVKLFLHYTFPASTKDPSLSVYFDRMEIDCK